MDNPVAPTVIGRYVIHGKIASGGMASVHYGRLIGGAGFARTVAIKRLHPHLAEDPEFRATLIDEARLVARVHHPNVVPTLDVVAESGELMVIMEYVRGESLARLLRGEWTRRGRIPLPVVSSVLTGALQGLHAAHEARSDHGTPLGLVHRDVSPQNILVGIDGVTRIIDFGVAKAAGRLQSTREGVVKGKMAYMAPEQLEAQPVSRAADIYAMAVVLWETITGERLFDAESDVATFGKVLDGAQEPPSSHRRVPPELDALVMRGLEVDPTRRFSTAEEMADALAQIVPPALPKEVGKWVEDVASDELAARAAVVAEIESSSDVTGPIPRPETPAPPSSRPRPEADVPEDEALTTASQPSSLSVVTPSDWPRGPRRVPLALVVGAAVAAGVVALALRSGSESSNAAQPPPAASNSAEPSRALANAPPTPSLAPPPPPPALAASMGSPQKGAHRSVPAPKPPMVAPSRADGRADASRAETPKPARPQDSVLNPGF